MQFCTVGLHWRAVEVSVIKLRTIAETIMLHVHPWVTKLFTDKSICGQSADCHCICLNWQDYRIGTALKMSVGIDATTPDLLLLVQQKLCIMQ